MPRARAGRRRPARVARSGFDRIGATKKRNKKGERARPGKGGARLTGGVAQVVGQHGRLGVIVAPHVGVVPSGSRWTWRAKACRVR